MILSPRVPRFDSRWPISDFRRRSGKKKVSVASMLAILYYLSLNKCFIFRHLSFQVV